MGLKRALLVFVLNAAGMAALVWLAGGMAGPGRGGPAPEFDETQESAPGKGSAFRVAFPVLRTLASGEIA